MPTYDITPRFWNDYDRLTTEQKEAFARARRTFTAVLVAWEQNGCQGKPIFPKKLRVKRMEGYTDINELAWAPDGRATWQYGTQKTAKKAHIVWRRVGTHQIYTSP